MSLHKQASRALPGTQDLLGQREQLDRRGHKATRDQLETQGLRARRVFKASKVTPEPQGRQVTLGHKGHRASKVFKGNPV